MSSRSGPQRGRGFTFIELMMSLAILGVLAAVSVPMAQLVSQRGKEQDLRLALSELRQALDAYKRASEQGRIERRVGESGYPKTLDDLVQGVPDQRSPSRQPIYFLRALPRDPMHPDPKAPAAETWALRSYASPPDDPQPGDDVFDVHSQSERIGLNGVPYAQW